MWWWAAHNLFVTLLLVLRVGKLRLVLEAVQGASLPGGEVQQTHHELEQHPRVDAAMSTAIPGEKTQGAAIQQAVAPARIAVDNPAGGQGGQEQVQASRDTEKHGLTFLAPAAAEDMRTCSFWPATSHLHSRLRYVQAGTPRLRKTKSGHG